MNRSNPPVPEALSYVASIAPYLPGKPITELSRELGLPVERIVKLASNENPLGMSPKARAAVWQAVEGLERYPDPYLLIQALAQRFSVSPSQVVLGNGSNDVLELVARSFLAPGISSVFSQYAFAVYPLAVQATGAEGIGVPARDFGHDLDAMRSALREDTRVVWIANPNNPTGTHVPASALRKFIESVPPHVVVVLDEAYNEYLPPDLRIETSAWLGDFPNLVITRTFSKIYGLAGLRVGYALASSQVADWMNRVRQPFNVNNLAIAAALAALDDVDFLAQSYEQNRRGMEDLVQGITAAGFSCLPSHGNFVTFGGQSEPRMAALNRALLEQGVIVRPLAGYGLGAWLRVTIGKDAENQRFLEALQRDVSNIGE